MTVEPDVVRRKLLEIGEATSHLRAGAHILSAEFQEAVDEYHQIPKRLLARGVLSPTTASQLKGLAGFFNVLVHEYADIDLRRVHAGLERLGDFDAFVADVEQWLQTTSR